MIERKQNAPATGIEFSKGGFMLFFLTIFVASPLFANVVPVASGKIGKDFPGGTVKSGFEDIGKVSDGLSFYACSKVIGKDAGEELAVIGAIPFGKDGVGPVAESADVSVGKVDTDAGAGRKGSSAGSLLSGAEPVLCLRRFSDSGKVEENGQGGNSDAAVLTAGKAGDAEGVTGPEVAEAGKAAAVEDSSVGESAPGSEVRVSLKGLDAELMSEIARLREERSRLQQEVRELELARRALEEENDGVHLELIEALQIIAGQNEKLLRLSSGVAGIYDADGVAAAGGEDARNLELLNMVSLSGGSLVVAVAEFCREVEDSLDDWMSDDAEKAEIRMQISHLRALAGEFSALNEWQRGGVDLENIRVLAVDLKLGAVILPAGTASGIFNGLVCSVPAAPGVKLKIVAVRRNVSAAVVAAGDPASISVGMKVVAKANAKTEEN